jgi:glycosyltransferase involved in cell wall biosynthesis
MRIAFVTTFDLVDVMDRSDMWRNPYLVSHYTAQALSKFAELEFVSVEKTPNVRRRLASYKRLLFKKVFRKKCLLEREPAILKDYARQVARQLEGLDVDLIFSPSTIPIAYLEWEKPIVFWTDATFAGMVDFYPDFINLCRSSIKNGNAMEKSVLERCARAIYTSDWAVETAVAHYGVDPTKAKVVPRGAMLHSPLSRPEITRLLKRRRSGRCNLLFLGNEWERKGGDIAIAVAAQLNEAGLATTLTIVGDVSDEIKPDLPPFVHTVGFVSKASKKGRDLINRLFAQSHFLLGPSRAETFGIAFCEASAFAVPSIAADVGGVRTAVRDHINGKLFAPDAAVQDYSEYILELMSDYDRYEALALSAFREHETRLNWCAVGRELETHLSTLAN